MKNLFSLHNMDAVEFLRNLESGSVDLCVTDPPYRTISGGKNDFKDKKRPGGILLKNDGKIFEHNDIDHKEWIKEVYRVLKANSDFYCMTNLLNLFTLKEIAESVGFKLHNLLAWKKNTLTPNRWYMKNAEFTLYFYKGRARPINEPGSSMIHEFKNIVGNKLHPTEKPVELMEFYIKNSSSFGELVLDPFMGSGTTGIAALNLHRNFLGCEIDSKYYNIAKERIENDKNKY